MTRIISGSARGRTLRVPEKVTRPTSDRVREALFSSLEHRLGGFAGLCVYDLYAGSGAFAFEARSRGAASAVLVEHDRRAVEVIKANATATGLAVTVVAADVAQFVKRPPVPLPDLIFADPPYDVPSHILKAQLEALLAQMQDHPVLLVLERSARDKDSPLPDGCAAIDVRTIGETAITYAHWYGYPHDGTSPA